MSNRPLVYISIINWNGTQQTKRCIESVRTSTYEHFKIIVVDNASRDHSIEQTMAQYPDIELIQAETNHGFAGGHTLALEKAQSANAELFWMLNNDATVQPDALERLVSAYKQYGTALYSSLPVRIENGQQIIAFTPKYLSQQYQETPLRRHALQTPDALFPDKQPQQVSALPGSCIMIPLDVIAQYGFMDTSFFMYAEEIDYCFRMHQKGIASIIVPASIVTHEGGGSQYNPGIKAVIAYYKTRNALLKSRRYDGTLIFITILLKKFGRALYEGLSGKIQQMPFTLRGIGDAVRNKRGKVYAPEDYL